MSFNHPDIILKISTSDLLVSSKPGVSTKQMSESRSSGKDSLTTDISLVQDSRVCPTLPCTPVAISMNCNTTFSDNSNLAETATYGTFPGTSRPHYAGCEH